MLLSVGPPPPREATEPPNARSAGRRDGDAGDESAPGSLRRAARAVDLLHRYSTGNWSVPDHQGVDRRSGLKGGRPRTHDHRRPHPPLELERRALGGGTAW